MHHVYVDGMLQTEDLLSFKRHLVEPALDMVVACTTVCMRIDQVPGQGLHHVHRAAPLSNLCCAGRCTWWSRPMTYMDCTKLTGQRFQVWTFLKCAIT